MLSFLLFLSSAQFSTSRFFWGGEINSNKHLKGSLSMAHAGKDTGGSQFFIVYEPQPHLDGVHTVFGKTDDMDVVLKLTNGSKILKATLK